MEFFKGISYNLRGLRLSLTTPKLLGLGLVRFAMVLVFTGLAVGFILAYYQDWMSLIWAKPANPWVVWLWHLVSWMLVIMLSGIAAIVAYLAAQILFSALIMDQMSRITEKLLTGQVQAPVHVNALGQLWYVVRQEIPRAFVPVALMLALTLLGWATPLGPILTVMFSISASTFLAWDSTDLTPARRMQPFRKRLEFLRSHLLFHIGFGLLFLIPLANLIFLAFSPVGATLYYVEHHDDRLRPL